jgi:transposase
MIGWVKNWLEEQRKNGETGLEVKKVGNNFYVYRSTTYWDKQLKKIRKHSKYLGKLDKEEGFKKSQRVNRIHQVNTVWQYGNARLLTQVFDDLVPSLKEGFKSYWEDVFALALVRTMGYVPLKRVRIVWEKLYNVYDLSPDLSPKMLSRVLKSVGLNRKAQNMVFNHLSVKGDEFVYDLSCFFTQSDSIGFAETGYNKDRVQLKQINLALLCSVDSGLPTMIRLLPGSVRDIASMYGSLEEIGVQGKILILDRGFYSLNVIDFLKGKKVFFVLPTRRNSSLYDVRIHMNQHLFYHERLIKCGKRKHEGCFLYVFEDVQLKLEEEKHLYAMLDEQRIDKEKLKVRMKQAGCILVVSNMDVSAEEIFLLYKKRDGVENLFDVYKTTLQADRTYLRSNESIFGHAFISFLSLYAYSAIHQRIKKAGLESKLSPLDVLEQFSKVYKVDCGGTVQRSEVPKKVRLLDEKLKTHIFPN